VKEPPKVGTSSGGQRKEQPLAATVVAYALRDSPLLNALMRGDSIHQLLVDSRGDYAIFLLDANGHVASWNKGAEQLKGYSRDEIIGKHFSVFYPPQDRAQGKPEKELVIAAREGRFEEEGTRLRKDGSEFWANIVLSAVRDETDTLVGFVKVTRDLTEWRRIEERALADAQALKAANAELEAFTYSVSHDLRAPIRQIEGFAKILGEHLGKDAGPEVVHYLHRIQEGSQQMGQLVDNLLDLARIGRQRTKPRRISLDSLVDQVLSNLRAEITDRDIEWRVESLPAVVCDPGLMHVAFTNLLSNAVKYTRPRAKAVIQIGQLFKNGQLIMYVRDNGVGFDMKYADKLFGVFQRLHRTEEFEGAGVGLATVQRIIHKHNGTIWAEAAPGAGATFFFALGDTDDAQATDTG
jgi:PAS domain S-box-containing protein